MNYTALHLDPEEHVIFEVRRHWIIFLEQTVGLILSATLPFLVWIGLGVFAPNILSIDIPVNGYALFTFLYSLWILILWLAFFVNWTKYYLDVWYVTEKRIIAVEQKRIFNREISNIRFDKVQDVTVKVRGIIATFLDFGNVEVQTASEDNRQFQMRVVSHPGEVRRVIFEQQNRNSDTKAGV